MYSEPEDFNEKLNVYRRMSDAIFRLTGEEINGRCSLALEIGGSGGILAGIVANSGPKVICTDVVDVQVSYGGEFPRLLKEKFERNGHNFDYRKIEFHTLDAQELLYGDEKFDLVFSLNAFEHIPDPIKAINEVSRVLRKGGFFYASFDPVWTADSGSHFIEYVNEPWLHLLSSVDDFREKMHQGGAADWQITEYPQAMNGRTAHFYKTEFKDAIETLFSKNKINTWSGCVSDAYTNHINRKLAAQRLGLDPDILLIRGFEITAKK
jgi:SAM-dependent methyltransferase